MGFLSKLLGTVSGQQGLKVSEQLLFDKVIGFRSVVPGTGCSTILHNIAVALSDKTSYNICILDVNYLYPLQYPLLVSYDDGKHKDALEFFGDIAQVALPTNLKNVYLVALNNRTVVDMLSSKDSEVTIDKLIGALKSYFDIILVDLSHEFSNINVHAGIRCNKIFNVADPSLKCMYNLKKSLNTLATLAVSFGKSNKVILNKQVSDMVLGAEKALTDTKLTLIGTIPLSLEIAKLGVAGKKVWGTASNDPDIIKFNEVIDLLVDDITQKTPLNEKYLLGKDTISNTIVPKIEVNTAEENAVKTQETKPDSTKEIEKDTLIDVTNKEVASPEPSVVAPEFIEPGDDIISEVVNV